MALAVHEGGQAHQHGAGVVAQNAVVGAFQPPQAEQGEKRPADIIEKDHRSAVALAGDFPGTVNVHALMQLGAGAGVAVAVKPFPLGVIGQPAQYIHLNAVGHKSLHNVVDAEVFGPVMLGYH